MLRVQRLESTCRMRQRLPGVIMPDAQGCRAAKMPARVCLKRVWLKRILRQLRNSEERSERSSDSFRVPIPSSILGKAGKSSTVSGNLLRRG